MAFYPQMDRQTEQMNQELEQYLWFFVDYRLSQIRYSLVVILELNGVSEVQYKDVMMIDDEKYQQE